jgi:pimeloyl-ACP methyl ester carboxylesterase
VQAPIRYARSGDVHIAYQVVGNGPRDIVFPLPFVGHIEHQWQEPGFARQMGRLASLGRLILLDKRGTGLSDRVQVGTLEERMDDIRTVMDATGSRRAALVGMSEGGPLTIAFAATHPERAEALILYGTGACRVWQPDYPWRPRREEVEAQLNRMAATIGETWERADNLVAFAPSRVDDQRFRVWWGALLRVAASPGAAVTLSRMNAEIDVRHVLPTIRVPTLVLHRAGDRVTNVEEGRYLARKIPDARYVELPGDDHLAFVGDADAINDEIEEFLTGTRQAPEPDRVLATVLFTDIVGSTERAAALGDRRWRDLLDEHHAVTRRELERFRGREVHSTGDGFLATFDGPARGVRCAQAIVSGVKPLGLEVRAGLHTGEIELMGDDVGGIAVHIGARVGALAGPGEVLTSTTVKDLVAGSGLTFTRRGTHTLRGVPGRWRLFAATGA